MFSETVRRPCELPGAGDGAFGHQRCRDRGEYGELAVPAVNGGAGECAACQVGAAGECVTAVGGFPFQQFAVPGEPFRQYPDLDLAAAARAQHRVAVVAGPVFLYSDDGALGVEPAQDVCERLSRRIEERGVQAQLPYRAAGELAEQPFAQVMHDPYVRIAVRQRRQRRRGFTQQLRGVSRRRDNPGQVLQPAA